MLFRSEERIAKAESVEAKEERKTLNEERKASRKEAKRLRRALISEERAAQVRAREEAKEEELVRQARLEAELDAAEEEAERRENERAEEEYEEAQKLRDQLLNAKAEEAGEEPSENAGQEGELGLLDQIAAFEASQGSSEEEGRYLPTEEEYALGLELSHMLELELQAEATEQIMEYWAEAHAEHEAFMELEWAYAFKIGRAHV